MLFSQDQAPVVATSLTHYITDRLAEFAERLDPPPQEETCIYLGAVLARFGRSERLFCYEDGRFMLRSLAQLYGDALEAPDERTRCLMLQQLGDLAMFVGAVFPHRYRRYGINRDYFVGMGGGAYDYLAGNARRHRSIFAELAGMFARLLELVSQACRGREQLSAEEVLLLYERWLVSKEPLVEQQLRYLGIRLDGSESLH